MELYQVEHISSSTVKAFFGLHPTRAVEVLFTVLPERERGRTQRLAARPERKRALVAGDGRPRAVTPLHKTLMTLLYLRHNVSHVRWSGCSLATVPIARKTPSTNCCRSCATSFLKRNGQPKNVIARNPNGRRTKSSACSLIALKRPWHAPVCTNDKSSPMRASRNATRSKPRSSRIKTGRLAASPAHRGPAADVKIVDEQTPLPESVGGGAAVGDKA